MSHVADDGEYTPAEIEAWERGQAFARDGMATPDEFPRLFNMSAGFMKRAVIRPVAPEQPEYLTIRLPWPQLRDREQLRDEGGESLKRALAVHQWNQLWEAAQFRRRFFDEEGLPPDLAKIADRGDQNIIFVPRTRARYYEYAPLYHLLDRDTCERFGLPLVRSGQWPFGMEVADVGKYLPDDFGRRLSKAWAATVWPHLISGSGLSAFSPDDPIRLLAHNLDYWLPPVTEVVQDTLRGKVYRKRNKIAVKFVELPDTIPVQGPETEVQGNMVFADFMALLDEKERQIVILLSGGYTKLTDIAAEMGYANHSPISKKLTRIRRQTQLYFDGGDADPRRDWTSRP